jgi:hypothetical protein
MSLWSVNYWDAPVFLEPLQLFANFDFSVPRVLAQAVTFAGKDQQGVRDA